jgi:sensor histidine kinase YesM
MKSAGVPKRIAGGAMQECKIRLNQASAKLEEYMHDVINQLISIMSMAQNDRGDLERLREEWLTARQYMDICSRVDNDLKESISIIND